jgi:hypothetical protein
MHQVPAGLREIRSSLMLRNKLAQYTARGRVAPDRSKFGLDTDMSLPRNGDGNDPSGSSQIRCEPIQQPLSTYQKTVNPRINIEMEGRAQNLEYPGTALKSSGAAPATAAQGSSVLPPTIDNQLECGRCFVSDTCMLYRRVGRH